jgi:dihydrofolate synthase/folylpolyglutamate synthase
MFTRIGAAAFKKDLTNTLALCNMLNQPERKFRSIHIAGTNGKGSTSHMLASILQAAGYRTGLYTSPHLKDFRERIRINGIMIPEEAVIAFVEKYQKEFESISPSFFEWTVALCFDWFAQNKIDVAVVETGLGGRLDSTNVISPLLSVITNIGWDHMDLLGDSLEKIAFEKAGIIKNNTPIVIGETQPETISVFMDVAEKRKAAIQFADQNIRIESFKLLLEGIECNVKSDRIIIDNLYCDLGGIYQEQNVKTVLESVVQMIKLGFIINEESIRKGLSNVKSATGLQGRWQTIGHNPLIICDTGHNVNGMEYVVKQLSMQTYDQLHFVIGMVKDKDIGKVLNLLPKEAFYYFCNADLPRALPAEELFQQAKKNGLQGIAAGSVLQALEMARSKASMNDLIFIGGSTFVVAEAI